VGKELTKKNANDQSACYKRKKEHPGENILPGSAQLSAEKGGVPTSLYNYPQKAEFSSEEGCTCTADKRDRGYFLYPWRWTQSPGALRCADTGRSRERPPRGEISYYQGNAGFRRCSGQKEGTFQIRNKTTKIAGQGDTIEKNDTSAPVR